MEKGTALFKLTAEQGLEGIVAKHVYSRYELNTRSKYVLKAKHFRQMDTVILGYKTNPFALAVAHFETVRNKPIAVIEHGVTMDQKRAFLAVAKGIHVNKSDGTQWIEPVLCCRVQYLE